MITEYLKNCKDLTYTEEILRDYILANPKAILDLSIKELANTCHVGMASVSRLCAKLGYKGYSEFKIEYIKSYKDLKRLEELNRSVPFDKTTTVDSIIEQLPLIYEKAIGYTKTALDKHVIIRCTERMLISTIVIFANGLNKSLAETFSYKLEELGLTIKVFDSMHYQYIDSLLYMNKDVFAILLTHSGKNITINRIAEKLKKRRIPSLLICNYCSDTLRANCSEIIKIIPTMNTKELSNVHYMIATQYVLDIIYSILLVKNLNLVESVGLKSGYYQIGDKNYEL